MRNEKQDLAGNEGPILGHCDKCGQVNITIVTQTGPDEGTHYNAQTREVCGPVRWGKTVDEKLSAIREASKHSFPVGGLPGTESLCEMCHGNGVVPVIGVTGSKTGTTVCPHCGGYGKNDLIDSVKKGIALEHARLDGAREVARKVEQWILGNGPDIRSVITPYLLTSHPVEAKAESGENEAFKSSLEAFLSKWKDAGRDTVILMEGFSKGWLAHRDACPTPSAIPEVSRIAFEAGADWKMLREGFVQGLDSHDRKIAKAEAIRRYPDANPSGENSGDKK